MAQPYIGWKSSRLSIPSQDDPNEPVIASNDYFEDGVPAVDG
jgi:hypothetical protein